MSNFSDLSGLFYIQDQYLMDLSYIPTGNSRYDVSNKISNLKSALDAIYQRYSNVNPSIALAVSKQADMANIISKETERLNAKKNQVDGSLYSQKRMAAFSESYSQKYQSQMKILYVIIIMALIYLGLSLLHSFIPVPDIIFNIVIILVVLFGAVIIILTVRDIGRRNNMDFNKLNLGHPTNIIERNKALGFFNLSAVNHTWCVGSQCCPAGNTWGAEWDELNQQCKKTSDPGGNTISGNTSSGFTTISQCDPVSPYSPSEINNYTAITM